MTAMKLPVLHADWDVPVVLVPLAEILAGRSFDNIDWSSDDEWDGPARKRADYADGMEQYSTGGARSWDEWLTLLSTVGLRNPVEWDPVVRKLGNGHHRVTAAMDLGWTHMPVVLAGVHGCINGYINRWDARRVSDHGRVRMAVAA